MNQRKRTLIIVLLLLDSYLQQAWKDTPNAEPQLSSYVMTSAIESTAKIIGIGDIEMGNVVFSEILKESQSIVNVHYINIGEDSFKMHDTNPLYKNVVDLTNTNVITYRRRIICNQDKTECYFIQGDLISIIKPPDPSFFTQFAITRSNAAKDAKYFDMESIHGTNYLLLAYYSSPSGFRRYNSVLENSVIYSNDDLFAKWDEDTEIFSLFYLKTSTVAIISTQAFTFIADITINTRNILFDDSTSDESLRRELWYVQPVRFEEDISQPFFAALMNNNNVYPLTFESLAVYTIEYEALRRKEYFSIPGVSSGYKLYLSGFSGTNYMGINNPSAMKLIIIGFDKISWSASIFGIFSGEFEVVQQTIHYYSLVARKPLDSSLQFIKLKPTDPQSFYCHPLCLTCSYYLINISCPSCMYSSSSSVAECPSSPSPSLPYSVLGRAAIFSSPPNSSSSSNSTSSGGSGTSPSPSSPLQVESEDVSSTTFLLFLLLLMLLCICCLVLVDLALNARSEPKYPIKEMQLMKEAVVRERKINAAKRRELFNALREEKRMRERDQKDMREGAKNQPL